MSAMHAAVLRGPRDVRVEQRAQPSPGPGEAIVRVFASGLCGTDYRIWNGDRPVDYPRVMGHEFIGEVMAVGGDVSNVRPGQKVAVEPNYSCGRCPLCREGNRNLCLSRTAIGIDVDGGFAEQARLPARCCWPAPAAIDDDQLMLAEPLAVVVRAVGRGEARRGERAAVLGVGALGLLAIQLLKSRGLAVLAIGRTDLVHLLDDPYRVALPKSRGAFPAARGSICSSRRRARARPSSRPSSSFAPAAASSSRDFLTSRQQWASSGWCVASSPSSAP